MIQTCRLAFLVFVFWQSPSNVINNVSETLEDFQRKQLNATVKARGRLSSVLFNLKFLRECLRNGVVPAFISHRIKRAKLHDSLKLERVFLKDEIVKCTESLAKKKEDFRLLYCQVRKNLSLRDYLKFSWMLSVIDRRQRPSLTAKYDRSLEHLRRVRYGCWSENYGNIINLANYELSTVEKDVLSRGLDFGIPPIIRPEELKAEFEVFNKQLSFNTSSSREDVDRLKIRLADIATQYTTTKPDLKGFVLHREHLKALRELKSNKDLVLTKPDKGRATVIMKRTDYVTKMLAIITDESKFIRLGPTNVHDKTEKTEKELDEYLRDLKTSKQLTEDDYDYMKTTASVRPRMYGLPKIHKKLVPLRPIVSMSGSCQYAVSRWLSDLLSPVLDLYSTYCVKDTFEFCNMLRESDVPNGGVMCSFDVVSLFTNVPLVETIGICADVLYRNSDVFPFPPNLEEDEFRKLMLRVTSGVEFSFDDVMYRQCDGVAMGSPLGPVLANIFVGYCESKIPVGECPSLYCRFVDDSFSYCRDIDHCERFLGILNSLHPSLQYTCEVEQESVLPFLDVSINRQHASFVTSVYRKPTFTGLYIPFDSFTPMKYKINLMRNLMYRAVNICSDVMLDTEIEKLKEIFGRNGYPERLVHKFVSRDAVLVQSNVRPEDDRKPAFLRLPYIGPVSSRFEKSVKSVVMSTYSSVRPVIIFSTRRAAGVVKDVLPIPTMNSIIYNFECRGCKSRYIGRTLQRLSARIRQHIPLRILPVHARQSRPRRGRPPKSVVAVSSSQCAKHHHQDESKRRCESAASSRSTRSMSKKCVSAVAVSDVSDIDVESLQSSIAKHLVLNTSCQSVCDDSCFSILSRGRSKYHLEVLEALYIDKYQPDLCVQKTLLALSLFPSYVSQSDSSS